MCIVIVEDEPEILLIIQDVLRDEGYEAVGFNRPFDPKTLHAEPSLFVLDMMLPERTGIELAGALRDHGYVAVPMIAMSASSAMINQARQSGLFQAYLPKPFNLDHLLDLVERQLAA
jgi:DNA-binding response OmpR family regulator